VHAQSSRGVEVRQLAVLQKTMFCSLKVISSLQRLAGPRTCSSCNAVCNGIVTRNNQAHDRSVHARLGIRGTTPRCASSEAHISSPSQFHRYLSTNLPTSYSVERTLLPPPPLPIIISGPSGVGKDAVIRKLQEKRPDMHFVVTATSRPMRPGEVDGVDYFFVTKEQFEEWITEKDTLLEHAIVYGEYKGIPRKQVEDALDNGSDVILRVDVQGAATMKKLLPEAVSIFIVAETEKELVERLVARKTEEGEKMRLRIETARDEMERIDEFDYVVVNRDGKMEETVDSIETIVRAEKCRSFRRKQRI
jgi:guanylate kinase